MVRKKKEIQKKEVNEVNSVQRSPLVMFADAAMRVEKVRVAAQVRLTHLSKNNRTCPDTDELLQRTTDLEEWVDSRLAKRIKEHPTADWFSRVNGTGGELIGKIIGYIEGFGRFYEKGDPRIPPYVWRPAVIIPDKNNPTQMKEMVWVEGIERLTSPSKLRKYAGLVPGLKRSAGEKLGFNIELKTMLWRLGASFLKMGGLYGNKYSEFYSEYKNYLIRRFEKEGKRIIPTPSGRYCPVCEKEVEVKKAVYCPICDERLASKQEPEGVIYEGHVHMMAQRRMLQLFLDHLWAIWRETLNLPLRQPYPIEFLGHSRIITPWDMIDK